MNIRPLHDRILVRRIAEEETIGVIVIPDNAKEKQNRGEVVAVGSGRILENGDKRPLDVKAGDRVLFGKYNGSEVEVNGEKLMILREDEIYAIVEAE
jgi:chaperonin GroES